MFDLKGSEFGRETKIKDVLQPTSTKVLKDLNLLAINKQTQSKILNISEN